jgi:hypothetical protein
MKNLRESDQFVDIEVDGKVVDWINMIEASSCENGNKFSGSIKRHRSFLLVSKWPVHVLSHARLAEHSFMAFVFGVSALRDCYFFGEV